MGMKEKQIKSKSRVNKYGEVFTANKEVNNMLNLIDRKGFVNETVLEPACGTGNFLVEALERKLKAIDEQRHPTRLSYVRDLVTVLATLYGVDIQADNVLETRNRLAIMVNEAYRSMYHEDNKSLSKAVHFIITHNIMVGNTLELKNENNEPLKFAEWKMQPNGTIYRRDYTMQELIENNGECADTHRTLYKYEWLRKENNDRKQTNQVKRASSRTWRGVYQSTRSQCNARPCETRD
jgi:hypothetical protein